MWMGQIRCSLRIRASVTSGSAASSASRATYEAFLRCWSDPDRPIPEVAIARKMLVAGS
jgi:hypothetical protein